MEPSLELASVSVSLPLCVVRSKNVDPGALDAAKDATVGAAECARRADREGVPLAELSRRIGRVEGGVKGGGQER